ncbi:MAG: alpha/beta fold hydrolase [Candidatus Dormibacteria bacterium]
MTENSTRLVARPPVVGTVTSKDGTHIGYYRLGQGPGVIRLHGAGQSSENFRNLARMLEDAFTLYIPDRRGRGMSGASGEPHGLQTEIEDLSALLDASGADRLFGLSSGAVIAIETARVRPGIARLALYEPPLSFDGVTHGEWVSRFEREINAGKLGAALVTVLKGTSDRTAFRFVPRFPLAAALNLGIKRTANRPVPPGAVSPRALIRSVRDDAQTVREGAGPLERFAGLRCEVLLLGGSRSHRNLTASLDGLSRVLPGASTRRCGAGHTAADNGHQPALVAAELRSFFA